MLALATLAEALPDALLGERRSALELVDRRAVPVAVLPGDIGCVPVAVAQSAPFTSTDSRQSLTFADCGEVLVRGGLDG
jgi:hypothetical protein